MHILVSVYIVLQTTHCCLWGIKNFHISFTAFSRSCFSEALTRAQQCVCTISTSDCIQGVCTDTGPFPLVCEMEVVLTLDNSISRVRYFCTNDLFAECNIHPLSTNTSTGSSEYVIDISSTWLVWYCYGLLLFSLISL